MTRQSRSFADSEGKRTDVQTLIGLIGPSGGGKTYSALRLATGIQRVQPGEIYFIDTESKRALHYADRFKFRHVPFAAPFGSLDYLDALKYCVGKGARTVIVDSISHEHEGAGGCLDMHETELDRMAGDDYKKRAAMSMLAWGKSKGARRALINGILQMDCNFIFCFRAKEKVKITKGEKEPEQLGWQIIGGDEFAYEMTLRCLLEPGAEGVPTWNPERKGERELVKCPVQFDALRTKNGALDEARGEYIARWASGKVVETKAAPVVSGAREPGQEG